MKKKAMGKREEDIKRRIDEKGKPSAPTERRGKDVPPAEHARPDKPPPQQK